MRQDQPADIAVALSSPGRTIEGLICAAQTPDAAWSPLTAMNLPALRTTVGEMAAALGRVAGTAATDLLDWSPDPAVLSVVSTWPGNMTLSLSPPGQNLEAPFFRLYVLFRVRFCSPS